MLTKDQLRQLLEDLPRRQPRSRLDPYRELIGEMRRREYSYREIARFLAERCGVAMSHNAVRNFVKQHWSEISASPTTLPPPSTIRAQTEARENRARPEQPDAVRARIASLKSRPQPEATDRTTFRFDPTQPLQLSDEES